MGIEKGILYNNVEWKRSFSKRNEPRPTTPKACLHSKQVMLYIWWDWNGVLYYELLQKNQTINSNEYCSQLEQLKTTLDGKCMESVNRRCIIFHQDNKTSFFLLTRQKLLQLGQEVLVYPPCSQTLQISIYFYLYKILLMEKIAVP